MKRGSAILIAIFMIAAVGGIAFAIGRLFMLDNNLANSYENSTIAYYAAESGIEEGFLRYRYNKNTDFPDSGKNIFNLDNNEYSPSADPGAVVASPTERYYSLEERYKSMSYGDLEKRIASSDLNDSKYGKEYFVERDEAIKLDLSALNPSAGVVSYDLLVQFRNDANTGPCTSASPGFIELKILGKDDNITGKPLKEYKIALAETGRINTGLRTGDYLSVAADASSVLVFENLYNQVISQLYTSRLLSGPEEIFIKPVLCGAKIGLRTSLPSTEKLFPAPYNTIRSTGHYGNVTRTIEAKIDRQAGTVYDLFDYVLYKRD